MRIFASCSSKSVFFRVLCETVKDFVAKVGRAYEKNTENSEESEAMAKKVSCDWLLEAGSVLRLADELLWMFLSAVLRAERKVGLVTENA